VIDYIVLEGEGYDTDQDYIESWESNDTKYVIHGIGTKDSPEIKIWRKLNEYVFDSRYIIKPTFGNKGISRVVEHLYRRRTTRSITLIYDYYITEEERKKIEKIIQNCDMGCQQKGIKFNVIAGYTFEWSMLSISNLLAWAYRGDLLKSEDTTIKKKIWGIQ